MTARLKPLASSHDGSALWFVLALLLSRWVVSVVLMPASGAGLGDTEAYYTAWSYALASGYHDHPGVLAWSIALSRAIFGDMLMSTRMVPALYQGVTLLFLLRVWRRSLDEEKLMWAAALFVAIPIFGTGGLLASPDAPLAAAWAGTLWLVVRARDDGDWCLVGLGLAIAVASKWFGLVLLGAVWVEVWLGTREGESRAVRCYRFLMVGGLAGLGLLPQLWFEQAHQWTGLRYHAFERHIGSVVTIEHVFGMLGSHLLVMSPILLCLLIRALWFAGETDGERQAKRLTLLTLLPMVCITLLTREAEPHWPVLGWLPMLGIVIERHSERSRGWLLSGLAVGVVLQGLLWLHVMSPLLMERVPVDSYVPRYDLANDLLGWESVGEVAKAKLLSGEVDRVTSYHYTMCGQLAAAIEGVDSVFCASRRRDAFDQLLDGVTGRGVQGERLLYVRDNRYDEKGSQRLRCDAWGEEETLITSRGGREVHRFGLSICQGYRGLVTESELE